MFSQEDLIIHNKNFNLPHQTTQPGTMSNIQSRFHHHKASKDVANFYASWDLLEICSLSNLVALAQQISGISVQAKDTSLSEMQFRDIVDSIFLQIDMFSKWRKDGNIPNYTIFFIQEPVKLEQGLKQ